MSDLLSGSGDSLASSKIKKILLDLGLSLLSIVIALLVGAIFIVLAGESPAVAYGALYEGALGGTRQILSTFWRSTPLIFTGFALAIPFRAGLFNIGGEGQLLVGGFSAAFVGFYFELPAVIHAPFALLAGVAAGGIWALIPAVLKALKGAHEVIVTIMMNYIATYLTIHYGINYFREGGRQALPDIHESAEIFRLAEITELPLLGNLPFVHMLSYPGLRLHVNFLLALISALLLWFLLWKTTYGYEIRSVGLNPSAAEYGGISSNKNIIISMVIGGALAGLAGAGEALGTHHTFIQGMDAGHGFTGIAVALLGRNHPAGIILAGILFGGLSEGGLEMQFAGVPAEIVEIVQGLIIFFVAALQMLKYFLARRRAKGEDE
ncbi:ABC transporter permease [Halarsenatibacter silvermanii]|uniref:Nucleoside ABC transporter membrane protein n=1 Tax=Halarsenatibacter silvermanii TaxID=321763 RepID=A0A1G9NJ06_9FIRM|nr:ABC transporter permease [Halarsenatibacter silvermanii]SDL86371.1 nucleoside ABC transporter membrane protein [Halarsenatibacter silvermanii]